jgi:hypothetical protein
VNLIDWQRCYLFASINRFLYSLVCQWDIDPTSEQICGIPHGLTVPHEDEKCHVPQTDGDGYNPSTFSRQKGWNQPQCHQW